MIVPASVDGPILVCSEGLSFWGGVDPTNGVIIDAHHPQHGQSLVGKLVLMPTSRGSCSGSGVLLDLAMNGLAPAALIFREEEGILTLGALIATLMFDCPVAVLRLPTAEYELLSTKPRATLSKERITADGLSLTLPGLSEDYLELTEYERAMLDGAQGLAVKRAMQTICTMASVQGATKLVEVSRAHIDGCIYAAPAYLTFAQTMKTMGAKVKVPTTTNAISVDYSNWRNQGVALDFGIPASELAEAYVQMGVKSNFTCAPYQAEDAPSEDEYIGWSESNAVIYANTVLGARTEKHPDFFDLFIALTGRAPLAGVYLDDHRVAQIIIDVELPEGHDDAVWPMLGWLVGHIASDRIPLLTGLEGAVLCADDLRAICASFGTTSAAPMLHIAGVTPEASRPATRDAKRVSISHTDFVRAWGAFNSGPAKIDLVALGSPHFSLDETRAFAGQMKHLHRNPGTAVVITLGRETKKAAQDEGLISQLTAKGIKVISDICWCTLTEPVFPPDARNLMTNSGKYAHYAPGLTGRTVRFGGLAECADAAATGLAKVGLPKWLT